MEKEKLKKRHKEERNSEEKMSLGRRVKLLSLRIKHWLTKGIWRTPSGGRGNRLLKAILIAVEGYSSDQIERRASSLAYRSILAIVPLLAIIIGVAKGFGIHEVLHSTINNLAPMHQEEWQSIYEFVENTLTYANSGLFTGVGLVALLYMVYNLLAEIEENLNHIWGISAKRPIKQQVVTYFGILLILPILLVTSTGITLTMRTLTSTFLGQYVILGNTALFLFRLVPFILIIFVFTGLLIVLPNTKVRFIPGFIGGIIAGSMFQLFQLLYMTGVVWVSRYSAVYGSLAFFFLMILWMQLTWMITLFSAKLAYAIQNVSSFFYIKEVNEISRRYEVFLTIVVLHAILKRFQQRGETMPHSAETLYAETEIPIRLIHQILEELLALDLIREVIDSASGERGYYLPLSDPTSLTIGEVIAKLDRKGTEDFAIDDQVRYGNLWRAIEDTRAGLQQATASEPLINIAIHETAP